MSVYYYKHGEFDAMPIMLAEQQSSELFDAARMVPTYGILLEILRFLQFIHNL